MNNVCLMGRLVADPSVKYTPNGNIYTMFTLAVSRAYKNKDGEKDADFISVKVWGKIAEIIGNNVHKGHRLAVGGRLETRSYEKDGVKKYVTEVVAEKIDFIEKKADGKTATADDEAPPLPEDCPEAFGSMGEEVPPEQLPF